MLQTHYLLLRVIDTLPLLINAIALPVCELLRPWPQLAPVAATCRSPEGEGNESATSVTRAAGHGAVHRWHHRHASQRQRPGACFGFRGADGRATGRAH